MCCFSVNYRDDQFLSFKIQIFHETNEPVYETNRLTDIENRLVIAKGEEGGRGMDWEFRVSRCKLLYIGWISNKVLL